jgi:hypothetical protein
MPAGAAEFHNLVAAKAMPKATKASPKSGRLFFTIAFLAVQNRGARALDDSILTDSLRVAIGNSSSFFSIAKEFNAAKL